MSGETEKDISGWTTDTLHAHLDALLDVYGQQLQALATDAREALQLALTSVDKRNEDRFAAVERHISGAIGSREVVMAETDRRYEQRFVAQERAVEIALRHSDQEFHEHLVQVREETKAALAASEKGIEKADRDLDKRLDKLNEFRGALADAQAQMAPRAEMKLLYDSLDAKLEAISRTMSARLEVVAKTVSDLAQVMTALRASLQGQDDGITEQQHDFETKSRERERGRNLVFGLIAAGVGLLGILFTVVVIGISLYLGLRP